MNWKCTKCLKGGVESENFNVHSISQSLKKFKFQWHLNCEIVAFSPLNSNEFLWILKCHTDRSVAPDQSVR